MKKLTPAQQQYHDIKKQHIDAILFFRMGDFYETFNEDAKICAKVLDIALTTREKKADNPTPMAGIPHHSAEKYIPKLLAKWYKIAFAEQTGAVVPGQIVKREVTQILTPWTYVQENKNNSYVLAISYYKKQYYVAWGDVGTAMFFTSCFTSLDDLKNFAFKLYPKEFIFSLDLEAKEELETYINQFLTPYITHWQANYAPKDYLQNLLKVNNLASFGKALDNSGKATAMCILLDYLDSLSTLGAISKISFVENNDQIYMDAITIKNMEILQSSYDSAKQYGLLAVIDKTVSPMGGRAIQEWILTPTKDKNLLQNRQEGFSVFMKDTELQSKTVQILKKIYDIERVSYLILNKKNSPFHWLKLKLSMEAMKGLEELGLISFTGDLNELYKQLVLALKDGDFSEDKWYIEQGFDDVVDRLRKIAFHSDELLLDYQKELSERTWIVSIRMKYVSNQGYFVEISKKDLKKIEEARDDNNEKFDFTRRQTLKIAERYTTTYLDKLQWDIYEAIENLEKAEFAILEKFAEQLSKIQTQIWEMAYNIAQIDIFSTCAKFFLDKWWVKPEFRNEIWIEIEDGKHPVIERFLPITEDFIPNNLSIGNNKLENWNYKWKTNNNKEDIVHIITWPNMWWKSTYLRQNAIILLLAHCGFFVPAKSCKTHILSGLFARVGSWDVLAQNQSTFMTEMIEVSNILNNADQKSFIIFDELGRGTSTYDGVAISQAVIEYIVKRVKAKTLFATHYHELIKLEEKFPKKVRNFSVAVYENQSNIVFMKKIVEGGVSKSYGIHVGELAGMPQEILLNAKEILKSLEEKKRTVRAESLFDMPIAPPENQKLKLIEDIMEDVEIEKLTPLEALNILNRLKRL